MKSANEYQYAHDPGIAQILAMMRHAIGWRDGRGDLHWPPYRNYFDCGSEESPSDATPLWRRAEACGLTKQIPRPSPTGTVVFYVTETGMRVLGCRAGEHSCAFPVERWYLGIDLALTKAEDSRK